MSKRLLCSISSTSLLLYFYFLYLLSVYILLYFLAYFLFLFLLSYHFSVPIYGIKTAATCLSFLQGTTDVFLISDLQVLDTQLAVCRKAPGDAGNDASGEEVIPRWVPSHLDIRQRAGFSM